MKAFICRIQNLLPDYCPLCKQEYCTKLKDPNLLNCKVCGQKAYHSCILDRLGITGEKRSTLTSSDVWKMLNPLGLTGLHYLCAACEVATIPSEDVGKLKRKTKSTSTAEATHQECTQESIAESDVFEPPSVSETQSQNETSEKADTSVRLDQPQITPKKSAKPKPTCPFYIKGLCRHGISGKTNGNCSKAHPTLCQKLMTYGDKRPRGCSKGKDCDKLHPKMCPSSLSHRECLNETCTLYHVKGTRRQPTNPQPESEDARAAAPQDRNSPTTQPHRNIQQHDSQIPAAFLGMLQAWRQELMISIDQRIMEIHQKLASPHASPPSAAVPQAAVTYIPTSHLIHQHQVQGTQHPMARNF